MAEPYYTLLDWLNDREGWRWDATTDDSSHLPSEAWWFLVSLSHQPSERLCDIYTRLAQRLEAPPITQASYELPLSAVDRAALDVYHDLGVWRDAIKRLQRQMRQMRESAARLSLRMP